MISSVLDSEGEIKTDTVGSAMVTQEDCGVYCAAASKAFAIADLMTLINNIISLTMNGRQKHLYHLRRVQLNSVAICNLKCTFTHRDCLIQNNKIMGNNVPFLQIN